MSLEELSSILTIGRDSMYSALQLLADEPDSHSTGDLERVGRQLDHVAYDLRRLGHLAPARLAYSVAFVINGLADAVFDFDRGLADNASSIGVIFCEMILELETAAQITSREPIELIGRLHAEWILSADSKEHIDSSIPDPHFHSTRNGATPIAEEVLKGIAPLSVQLADATESFMERVLRIADFPYSSTLTRIHHLATAIRDRTAPRMEVAEKVLTGGLAIAEEFAAISDDLLPHQDVAPCENVLESPADEQSILAQPATSSEVSSGLRRSCILVVDDSPFFQMLLKSAIESRGYSVRAVANLEQASDEFSDLHWSLVFWGDDARLETLNAVRDWLSTRESSGATIAVLVSELLTTDPPAAGIRQIRRADLAGIMSLVSTHQDEVHPEARKIA